MATLIKNLRNGRKVVFDTGGFDEWCVYIVESDGSRTPPRDITYFAELRCKSQDYPDDKIYNDFVEIYEQTTSKISEDVLTLIDEIVNTYEEKDKVIMEQWFTVLYGGIIAEENKKGTILKKRIKRLGMYQTLKLGMNPQDAANYSKRKKVWELDPLMRSYGF